MRFLGNKSQKFVQLIDGSLWLVQCDLPLELPMLMPEDFEPIGVDVLEGVDEDVSSLEVFEYKHVLQNHRNEFNKYVSEYFENEGEIIDSGTVWISLGNGSGYHVGINQTIDFVRWAENKLGVGLVEWHLDQIAAINEEIKIHTTKATPKTKSRISKAKKA